MITEIPNEKAELEKTMSSEEKKKILKQRAMLLKIKPNNEEEFRDELAGIEFLLGDEHYFIESTFVVEVAHLKELTPLPGTPSTILGIFNLRGKILAIISLKKLINLPEKTITNHNRIIILKYQDIELGILADEIAGTSSILKNKLQLNIPGISEKQNDFLMGISPEGLIVLNTEKLLFDSRITINQKV
jgi:purine-binding chemotaxis protein CheW